LPNRNSGSCAMPVKPAEYRVVINDRRRYSLWLAHKENPPGWYDAGKTGPEPECVAFIENTTCMGRMPEPELMLDEEQAAAYAGADLSELHEPMPARFRECFPSFSGSQILDLGCGSADITIRFARAYPDATVRGIDGSDAMLVRGRDAVSSAALDRRVVLEKRHLPDESLPSFSFDAVISNSLLHHLLEPSSLWQTVRLCAKPGASVMVMDLRRPADPEAAEQLVERYAAEAHPALRRDFFNSLCAAYTAVEIRQQLRAAGLSAFRVEESGDLHITVWGAAPGRTE
jgi:ubiquinone/menaquinone biosynthesis C-methylase UbiE/uncharacterized protein YbdZ (MbtH family)